MIKTTSLSKSCSRSFPLDDSLDLHKTVQNEDKKRLRQNGLNRISLDFHLNRKDSTSLTLAELKKEQYQDSTGQLSRNRVKSANQDQETTEHLAINWSLLREISSSYLSFPYNPGTPNTPGQETSSSSPSPSLSRVAVVPPTPASRPRFAL